MSSSLKVTLPDGTILDLPPGATTLDVASKIGAGLARAAVAGKVTRDGHSEIMDLSRPLPGDCCIKILTKSDDDPDALYVLRHSTAHVMAEAVCKLFPETQLVYGPPLEDGFYYDIDLPRSITPEDFAAIEAEMARIVKEDRKFTRLEMNRADGMAKLAAEQNRYKVDNAERAEGDTLSFYVTGDRCGQDFEDLCRGPHIPSTGVIGAFKVRQVSGSHYRGDVNDQRLQRVYGTAFFKKASLAAHLEQLEQAKARDHRVIGQELGLFTIDPLVGSGLILWKPKGATIRLLLEEHLRGKLREQGYQPVFSPHVGRLELYRTSGHFPYYRDSQFPPLYETETARLLNELWIALYEADKAGAADPLAGGVAKLLDELRIADPPKHAELVADPAKPDARRLASGPGHAAQNLQLVREHLQQSDGFLLKPMNCPHHVRIYASEPRSYKDLPIRLAEFGTVYRYEQSGELSGLTRVRGFTQDDAHLFCTPEQLPHELDACLSLTRYVLDMLGLGQYRVRIGLHDPKDPKFIHNPEGWRRAEEAIRVAAAASGMAATEEVGEAAFYGPKIDFVVKDCIGRQWQLGTVQVDYNLPERFNLTYVGPDNRPHRPVMIHRAPFGSMERFVGILIEHFAGAFPLWLSPVQMAVVTVSEKSDAYAREVHEKLRVAGFRAELDLSSEKIGPKKHRHRQAKVNYILVVGESEAAKGEVNVNDRDGKTLGNRPLEAFIEECRRESEERKA
ncbi:MAG: threonine--tRNA ligase [Phycisphaerales bacterium]|nr:threonine--tRNA ligase [Phycisphaerales bacterium]